MKLVVAARAALLLLARRANRAKGWAATGRVAVESDRVGGGVHVPLEQVVTTHEAGVVQNPTTNAWTLRVRAVADLDASDRAAVLDAVASEWEPSK